MLGIYFLFKVIEQEASPLAALLRRFIFFIYVHVSVLGICLSECGYLRRPEEGVGTSGTGVTVVDPYDTGIGARVPCKNRKCSSVPSLLAASH